MYGAGGMGQPSLILEYDLGGEGDLFKAPEPVVDEPSLLPPAAISMMSRGDDDAVNVGLFKALYECEKEFMEKSVVEETISELLDVEITMLRVEEEVPAGELHNSPSSGSDTLSPSVWPNFLDFQGLDLEAALGLSTAYCQGDIQIHGANTPRPRNSGNVHTYCDRLVTICDLKAEERKQKLSRYRMKKIKRNFGRKIKYACRKAVADTQPRVRGRFSKMVRDDILRPRRK